ncbi:MAG: hypothetical protein L0Z73_06795 [Gammaproteobacteria bacterium]|nr:hypothetical protein [Gammaproteobacteria bacterium]
MRMRIINFLLPRPIAQFLFALGLLTVSFPGFSKEYLWDFLEQRGKELDIMSISPVAGQIVLVGARYVEVPWPMQEESETAPFSPSLVSKQLYVISTAANNEIVWRQGYPVLPDVQEIFSTAATSGERLCVVYGEQSGSEEVVLDPVLLQLDSHGKILWAKRNLIAAMKSKASGPVEQIANLDTLRVVGSPDNGCVLAYVTRTISGNDEKFNLHVIHNSFDGDVKWQQTLNTPLYGKLFLVHNEAANRYVIVQTNQSRDAAIQAMMLAVPFVPKTALIGLDYMGNVSFQTVEPDELSKLWVKNVAQSDGETILLAGKVKAAWVGRVSFNGSIKNHNDGLDGEFSAAAVADSGGYLLSRGDHLTLTTSNLELVSDQPARSVITRQYLNQYLMARLPDDLPVQQIVPAGNNEYLLLYTLGSKLLKVRVEPPKH